MKKQLLLIALSFISLTGFSQTAVNFNCNDCSSASHDLFSELDAGKVIVLCWVMPCSNCVAASTTTYNIVDSYQSSYPNTVYMYLCDDYANTSCASLNTWKYNNGLDNAITFSNASINMADYGSTGMPKIVVVGGPNHTVFYNANNAVNSTNLQNAINTALSATGISTTGNSGTSLSIFPNPAAGDAEIKFSLEKSADITIELFNLEGQKVQNLFSGKLSAGNNKLKVGFSNYPEGMYLVKFTEDNKNRFMNIVVSR
jgi:hypothetical protein